MGGCVGGGEQRVGGLGLLQHFTSHYIGALTLMINDGLKALFHRYLGQAATVQEGNAEISNYSCDRSFFRSEDTRIDID